MHRLATGGDPAKRQLEDNMFRGAWRLAARGFRQAIWN